MTNEAPVAFVAEIFYLSWGPFYYYVTLCIINSTTCYLGSTLECCSCCISLCILGNISYIPPNSALIPSSACLTYAVCYIKTVDWMDIIFQHSSPSNSGLRGWLVSGNWLVAMYVSITPQQYR